MHRARGESGGPCKVPARIPGKITCEPPFINIVKTKCTTYPKPGTDSEIEAAPAKFFVKDGQILARVAGLFGQDEITGKICEYSYG